MAYHSLKVSTLIFGWGGGDIQYIGLHLDGGSGRDRPACAWWSMEVQVRPLPHATTPLECAGLA